MADTTQTTESRVALLRKIAAGPAGDTTDVDGVPVNQALAKAILKVYDRQDDASQELMAADLYRDFPFVARKAWAMTHTDRLFGRTGADALPPGLAGLLGSLFGGHVEVVTVDVFVIGPDGIKPAE